MKFSQMHALVLAAAAACYLVVEGARPSVGQANADAIDSAKVLLDAGTERVRLRPSSEAVGRLGAGISYPVQALAEAVYNESGVDIRGGFFTTPNSWNFENDGGSSVRLDTRRYRASVHIGRPRTPSGANVTSAAALIVRAEAIMTTFGIDKRDYVSVSRNGGAIDREPSPSGEMVVSETRLIARIVFVRRMLDGIPVQNDGGIFEFTPEGALRVMTVRWSPISPQRSHLHSDLDPEDVVVRAAQTLTKNNADRTRPLTVKCGTHLIVDRADPSVATLKGYVINVGAGARYDFEL
jgi:hypothetical protein